MEYVIPIVGLITALYLFSNRLFLDHITYSGNLIDTIPEDGEEGSMLRIRTIQVLPMEDLLPSNIFFKIQFLWAIYKCNEKDMFVRMSKKSMDILQPAILNGLAAVKGAETLEEIATGHREHLQVLFAITFENYGHIKSQKIRVMVIARKTLEGILTGLIDVTTVRFERDYHRDRIKTLIKMAKLWETEQSQEADEVKIVQQVEVPI